MEVVLALAIFAGLLIFAAPYVRRNRHPKAKPTEAYLVFAVAFGVVASPLFGVVLSISMSLEVFWLTDIVSVLLAVAIATGPALAVATWAVRQPPSAAPKID